MASEPHAIVNDSLERCANQAELMNRFYDRFLSSSEEIRALFAGTDMRIQKRMLRDSLYTILLVASGSAEAKAMLNERACRHSRNELNVRPELYDTWLDCMIAAVRDCDPGFDDETERAWRQVMQQGIDVMIAQY